MKHGLASQKRSSIASNGNGRVSRQYAVPRLAIKTWRGGKKRKSVIHYEEADHATLPHVVKFSGGRSSGLLLLTLLDNGILNAARGDVVLFTNTSAEHPATYEFVRKLKARCERNQIPFFITEFQTYETAANGIWKRKASYRLANAKPYDKRSNPEGYRYRGEIFLDAVNWNGMLPSVFTRMCTVTMKMLVTRLFLADYLGGCSGTSFLGHPREHSKVDFDFVWLDHKRNRGTMTREEIERRWNLLGQQPFSRPAQSFNAFSKPSASYTELANTPEGPPGYKVSLKGESPTRFLTFLGFRAGEDARYQRMISRNQGYETPGHGDHPPGEYSYAPLFDLGFDQKQVLDFWRKQPRPIRPNLPEHLNLSNCVYCFLKGGKNLRALAAEKSAFEKTLPENLRKECRKHNTPNNINWWVKLDKDHRRQARKKDTEGQAHFGMFGLKGFGYQDLKPVKGRKEKQQSAACSSFEAGVDCECTD